MPSRSLILSAVISCVAPLSALAQPLVPAVARFGDDGSVSSERLGRILAQELNCVACHKHDSVEGKQGPILTEVSSRINVDYIKQFIGQPQTQKPGTTMPDLFSASSPEQKELEVTALVNYLMTLGDGKPPQGNATYGARRRGEALYQQVGCAVCHDSLRAGAVKLPTSVPHADLAAKYTLPSEATRLACH